MSSPTRTRTRKANDTAKTAPQPDLEQFSEEDVALAAAQENGQYQTMQLQYLQGRVATLRLQLNRANAEIARLEQRVAD